MKRIRSRFAVYLYGILGALSITITLVVLVLRPPLDDLIYLALLLTLTGSLSGLVGYFSHRFGWWQRIPSLRYALALGFVLAATLTLLNVWITAKLMFVNAHDLALAFVLLVFAAGISVSFGYFITGSITQALDRLSASTLRVSEGDFSVRVEVEGDNELAHLATMFNEMAARLERAAAEARELDEARRNLVAWASHDLRTPLASLRAMIDALADGVVTDAETTARYLQQSQAEIARMNGLINDLFELAQVDAGRSTLGGEAASLADLISDTLAVFTARAQAKALTLSGAVAPQVDPVWMSTDKIGRVLNNLLENAVRHTPPGGTITLDARPHDGGGVLVTVKDSGEGIAPEDLPHIFDRFYRGEKSRTRDGYASGGAGLGLAIARGLVEAHGGCIWAESAAGAGTVMRFTLPGKPPGG